eukprot:TRINITY_DN14717_c0_g1_i1.p1 TRINITY_DN14717_c0_g1~~TRINITY_DN14717_c0_g1_i1.p1  ORF type:complete len:271 (-),score=51.74 TRINITY_DN14717_c0_g1_i1:39-821(-)
MAATLPPYTFTLPSAKDSVATGTLPSLSDRTFKDKLTQWGLAGDFRGLSLKFTGRYRNTAEDTERLLQQLFSCPEVLSCIRSGTGEVNSVKWEKLGCNTLSMDFFDCLTETGIVSANGHIRAMMEETVSGMTVGDRLRDALVNPDSDDAHAFDKNKKAELLYHVFKALVLGGAMCQPEDRLEPYLDATKRLYKDVVCVFRAKDDPAIQVASHAFVINAVEWTAAGPRLFEVDSPHNACLVVVTPRKGQVVMLHKTFRPYW